MTMSDYGREGTDEATPPVRHNPDDAVLAVRLCIDQLTADIERAVLNRKIADEEHQGAGLFQD
jgi:hypothetical protein